MFSDKSMLVVLGTSLLCVAVVSAQQAPPGDTSNPQSIHLNVVVTTASGQPVTDLQQKDFTILDNNSARTITSFKAVAMNAKPQETTPLLKFASSGAVAYDQRELFQYEITYDAPTAERPDEYHRVEVKVDQPHLKIKTRKGYYALP
jgi:hypothetical protein